MLPSILTNVSLDRTSSLTLSLAVRTDNVLLIFFKIAISPKWSASPNNLICLYPLSSLESTLIHSHSPYSMMKNSLPVSPSWKTNWPFTKFLVYSPSISFSFSYVSNPLNKLTLSRYVKFMFLRLNVFYAMICLNTSALSTHVSHPF